MRVVLYARCSTDEEEEKQTTETQVYQLKDYCQRYDHEIVDIIEEYASGKDIEGREKFGNLIERAMLPKRSRGFDAIMCLRLDRFTRNVIDGLVLVEQLQKAECDLIFVHERYDTSTPQGKAFFTISLSWSQMYREELSDKVSEGIVRWQRENPDKTWGRQVRDDIDLRLALALLNGDGENTLSLRKTAERLGVSPSTLSDHLKRSGYVRNQTTGVYEIQGSENPGPTYILPAVGEVSDAEVCGGQEKRAVPGEAVSAAERSAATPSNEAIAAEVEEVVCSE